MVDGHRIGECNGFFHRCTILC